MATTWTTEAKSDPQLSPYTLKIDGTYFLLIDSTYKLEIQSDSPGTTWTNQAQS